jgi:hypothetical protein
MNGDEMSLEKRIVGSLTSCDSCRDRHLEAEIGSRGRSTNARDRGRKIGDFPRAQLTDNVATLRARKPGNLLLYGHRSLWYVPFFKTEADPPSARYPVYMITVYAIGSYGLELTSHRSHHGPYRSTYQEVVRLETSREDPYYLPL